MLYAAKSHIGLVRQMNQDGFAVHANLLPMQFLVVADGMGGPSAGEVASRIAVETVSSFVTAGMTAETNPETILREAVYHANQRIFEAAEETEAYEGMGTTLVTALVDDTRVVFAHVGDSRGYIYQNGELQQVTKDHSLVAEMVRRGQLTEEQAFTHPQRNIVTRSLGTTSHSVPDIEIVSWGVGDALLLCSDGLSNLIPLNELHAFLTSASESKTLDDLNVVADAMIRLALERGGPDNITFILALHREAGDVL